MTAPSCELLPWDSEFFGFRIARVGGNHLDRAGCDAIEAWCAVNAVECLYYLADSIGAEPWLIARGFVPVDVRLTLATTLRDRQPTDSGPVRKASSDDVPALREIAARSHLASRFFADPRLAARAPALYSTWIEKSVEGMADRVLVPNAAPVSGYITCNKPDASTGQIGLLGVARHSQGQGVGRRLIAAALDWFAAEGCETARVITQGNNARAVAAYQASGFQPIRSQQWYHRWFRMENS